MKLAENLKKAVLQAAMQGKLTRQLKTDSSVDDLLQKIAKEKARLIAEGKIKKEGGESLPLAPERKRSSATPSPRGTPPKTPDNSPQVLEENSESSRQRTTNTRFEPIPQEEIPFEIPENWRWVRIGNCLEVVMGSSPESSSINSKNEGIEFHQGKIFFGENYLASSGVYTSKPTKIVNEQFILLCVRAPVGKVNFLNRKICIGRGLSGVRGLGKINKDYLYYLLKTYESYFNKEATGTTFKAIGKDTILDTIIPLPPIEEQQRIVEKLNSILPLIDEYGKEEDELVALSQNFPEDIKKSVLQSAMQGKLTKQLQTDSSVDDLLKKIAEEKETLIKEGKIKKDTTKAGASGRALEEITQEEIPFEIPENWRWVHFSDVMDIRDGTHDSPRFFDSGIPMVTSKNLKNGIIDFSNIKYVTKEVAEQINLRSNVDTGDILFAMIGSIGNPVIVNKDREFVIKNMALFKNFAKKCIKIEYVYNFLILQQVFLRSIASGGVQSFIALNVFRKMLFPLPPIEEQQRIVEKLNQILPIIDSMAVYGTKKKAGRPKQEEALSFIRTFLQAKKQAQPKTAAPEILELKTKAKQELPAAVKKYAGLMGVTYNRITIRHQKTRWGSCTKTGNLNFNCLIMKMPDQVRDYVIIHELAHRKELNHSSKYWAIVAEYCPWYKQAKQWLKDNGQELMER
ncbi:YgjP-like metallopeptidase domain-containing protein [Treponema porcinum]|uniref:YgjP-like metallopeptidase domain-containing protein n=1 Tax=Treponema porcinum TaxID=261392 RepID=UPI003F05A39D